MPRGIYKHNSNQGYQKGHGLLGNNPTSKGKNWKLDQSTKDKMSKRKMGNKSCLGKKNALGKKWTEEQKLNHRESVKNGENHYKWISDRNSVQKRDHNSTTEFVYTQWRIDVFKRDIWKCKINNSDCNGQLEAHHILNWTDYPELRYDINNGITLCHAHHPRGRANEKRLSPYFMDLVSVSKEHHF